MPVLAAVPVITETQPTVEVMRLSCDKETVSQAFKAMESDEKKALNQAFGKFQSFFSSHDLNHLQNSVFEGNITEAKLTRLKSEIKVSD